MGAGCQVHEPSLTPELVLNPWIHGWQKLTQREHFKRDHSSKDACPRCKTGIVRQSETGVLDVCDHSKDPEWMDEEQEARHKNWAKRGSSQATDAEKWTWIYQSLFPKAIPIPNPYYDYLRPSHRDHAPSVEMPVPSARNGDTSSNLFEGVTPSLQNAGSSEDSRTSKRARVEDTYIEYEDSQSISRNITNFSVSSGVYTGDSGISLSYDLDQDDSDRLLMNKSSSSHANLDPALLSEIGTEFPSDEQLEWKNSGEGIDYATSDEQEVDI